MLIKFSLYFPRLIRLLFYGKYWLMHCLFITTFIARNCESLDIHGSVENQFGFNDYSAGTSKMNLTLGSSKAGMIIKLRSSEISFIDTIWFLKNNNSRIAIGNANGISKVLNMGVSRNYAVYDCLAQNAFSQVVPALWSDSSIERSRSPKVTYSIQLPVRSNNLALGISYINTKLSHIRNYTNVLQIGILYGIKISEYSTLKIGASSEFVQDDEHITNSQYENNLVNNNYIPFSGTEINCNFAYMGASINMSYGSREKYTYSAIELAYKLGAITSKILYTVNSIHSSGTFMEIRYKLNSNISIYGGAGFMKLSNNINASSLVIGTKINF